MFLNLFRLLKRLLQITNNKIRSERNYIKALQLSLLIEQHIQTLFKGIITPILGVSGHFSAVLVTKCDFPILRFYQTNSINFRWFSKGNMT